MIVKGFSLAKEKWQVLIYPAVMDFITLILTFAVTGYAMQQTISFQVFSFGPRIPSINDILTDANELLVWNMDMSFPGVGIMTGIMVVLLLFALVSIFIEAGFFHLIWQGGTGKGSVTFQDFLSGAKHYWVRFLLMYILFFVLLFIPALLFSFMGLAGFIILLIGGTILRVVFIYFELTIIADDIGLFDALGQSFTYFKSSGSDIIVLLVVMAGATGAIGFVVNYVAQPVFMILMTPLYLFVVTGFMFAMAILLERARQAVYPDGTTN